MPRATPISDKSQVSAEYQSVAEDVVGVFGRIRGPFSVFLNSPKLADKMLSASGQVQPQRLHRGAAAAVARDSRRGARA